MRSARRSSRPVTASASGTAAAATSICSRGSASTCAACRSSTTCRRATFARCSPPATSSTPRSCSAGRRRWRESVVTGDQRGEGLGFPTANLAVPPDLLVPALGIYAGAALGHRAAISIGTNPHYGGTERARRGLPARLRRRPLRPTARRRAVGAAAGRGGLRLRGGADRGDRERRRPDAGRGTPAADRKRKFSALAASLSGMEPIAPATRSLAVFETRPLSRVRRGLLEADRRAAPCETNPGCPTCGYRRLDPAHPAAGTRVAPLRRGSAAAPARPSRLTPPK